MPAITELRIPTVDQWATSKVDNAAYDTYGFESELAGSYRFTKPGITAEGNKTVTFTAKPGAVVSRFSESIAMPVVLDTGVNGVYVPEVVRTLRAKVEYIIPKSATAEEIAELQQFIGITTAVGTSTIALTDVPLIEMSAKRQGMW